jgi:serine protease Do
MKEARRLKELVAGATPVLSDAALRDAFTLRNSAEWKPSLNTERQRGGMEIYAATAPAIVAVQTNEGHGSGFLISPDGLIITNHHVIESGLNQRSDASFAMVHVGTLGTDGVMHLQPEPVPALLYNDDPINDLALLKLDRPANARPMPFIKLSSAAPKPGQECAIIGHPSSGMLWTFRPCQVSSIGDFPGDMVNLVMARLASTTTQRAEIEAYVKSRPPRRIMLTSAQANPGDSGGPVLDKMGALIGVTFGGPGDSNEDKFTYHVHLDEVRKFTSKVPTSPMTLPPDPWHFRSRVAARDLDGDGHVDVLVSENEKEMPEMMLFDLDNDTPSGLLGSAAGLTKLIDERRFDFEVAIDLRGSGYTAFYDTDNNGTVDLILTTDEDSSAAKGMFSRGADGKWHYQSVAEQRIVDSSRLKDAQLARRLEMFVNAIK